jgi:nucleoside-diphosphate-sugar epimerase
MSNSVEKTALDINKIPYDAPLSFDGPDPKWCSKKSFEGTWWSTLTIKDVPHKDLTGQWVLVSGGNNGIGREAALNFADMGANVLLACRQPPPHEIHPEAVVAECKSRARAAGHEKSQFEWFEVNYADIASVEAFAQRWLDTGRPLSILCNNAGMGSAPAPLPFKTKDGFEIIHQVNFLAHVLLTLRLLPSLAKAEAPRIVCTTSCYHYEGKFDLDGWNGRPTDPSNAALRYYQNNKLNFQVRTFS